MALIRPCADLRNCYNEISRICHETKEPMYITKNGANDLVVLSDEAYEDLLFTNHSLKKSKSFFYEVRKSALNLNIFPERYPRLSNYRKNKDENIRKLLLNNT